jgi:hypothetical protein
MASGFFLRRILEALNFGVDDRFVKLLFAMLGETGLSS